MGATMAWYDPREQEVTAGLATKYHLERGRTWLNLTVADAEWPRDAGTYRCAAANTVGSASLAVRLRVERECRTGGGSPRGWCFGVSPPVLSPQGTRRPPTSPSASCGTHGRAPRCGSSGGHTALGISPALWCSGVRPRNCPGGWPGSGKRPPVTSSLSPVTGAWAGWTRQCSTLFGCWPSTTARPGTPRRCRRQVKLGGDALECGVISRFQSEQAQAPTSLGSTHPCAGCCFLSPCAAHTWVLRYLITPQGN